MYGVEVIDPVYERYGHPPAIMRDFSGDVALFETVEAAQEYMEKVSRYSATEDFTFRVVEYMPENYETGEGV